MRYRQYSNGSAFLWFGVLLFIIAGGFKLLLVVTGLLFAVIFQFFPLIVLFFLFRGVFKRFRLGSYVNSQSIGRDRFVQLLIRLLVHAVKADGHVDERELGVIRQFFQTNLGFTGVKLAWVNDLLDHALRTPADLTDVCREFSQNCGYDAKLIALQLVYRVLLADGSFVDAERRFVSRLVDLLSIMSDDHRRVQAMFELDADSITAYHAVLGVEKDASKEGIKRAYRQACKDNHPDKVFHLGEEFQKVAKEKMLKINEAYDALMKNA